MRGKPVVHVHNNYRKKVGSIRSDRSGFSKSAGMTNAVNLRGVPMRGGYRL